MNTELEKLAEWFKSNKLAINIDKTKFMLFRNRNVNYNDEYSLNIDNRLIERCKCFNFLGMTIDELLSWNDHIKKMQQKLSYTLYSLRRLKHLLSSDNLTTLYYSLFHSHLDYGLLLWSNTSQKNIKIVQKLQKKALRLICKKTYNAPTAQLFETTKILNIEKCILKQQHLFMYKYVNNKLPQNVKNLLTSNQNIHNYNTRQKCNPHIQKRKRQITLNCFLHQAPIKWQTLPNGLKNYKSQNTFLKHLKIYLLTAEN